MRNDRWLNQKSYSEDDERKLRQELDERETQRQKSYTKDDEKAIKEEIDRTIGDDEQKSGEEKK